MKSTILLLGLLLSSVSLAATNCDDISVAPPSIPDQDLSKRHERQLNREMLEFLRRFQLYAGCVRNEFHAEKADGAPEPQLLELVAEHNTAVKEVDELVAIYEERIGPIAAITGTRAPRNPRNQRDPWARRPWPQTDTGRFPATSVMPPAMSP